jgi:YVTN family beta-propeller protein
LDLFAFGITRTPICYDFALNQEALMTFSRTLALLAVIAAATALVAADAPKYKLSNTFKVGGEGGWDYLLADPDTHNVFLSRGAHLMIINDQGQQVGDITGTEGIHGIALAPELGKGFTSNGRSNDVTVFDLKSLKETGKIKLEGGQNPDAILYDPATKHVFTFNGRSSNASVIDAANNSVIATIPVDGKPETGVSDGKGMVYVNIEDKGEIQQIDAKNNKVVNTWSIKPCEDPSGLAIDQKARRLFAGCGNKMMAIVNADTGKVIDTPAIGAGVDACGWDPDRKLAFSSNGRDATLTIIHEDSPDKFTVVDNVKTEPGARTMSLDPKSHKIYLVTADFQAAAPAEGAAATGAAASGAPAGANPGAAAGGTGSAAPAAPQAARPRRTMVPGTFRVLVVSSE